MQKGVIFSIVATSSLLFCRCSGNSTPAPPGPLISATRTEIKGARYKLEDVKEIARKCAVRSKLNVDLYLCKEVMYSESLNEWYVFFERIDQSVPADRHFSVVVSDKTGIATLRGGI